MISGFVPVLRIACMFLERCSGGSLSVTLRPGGNHNFIEPLEGTFNPSHEQRRLDELCPHFVKCFVYVIGGVIVMNKTVPQAAEVEEGDLITYIDTCGLHIVFSPTAVIRPKLCQKGVYIFCIRVKIE